MFIHRFKGKNIKLVIELTEQYPLLVTDTTASLFNKIKRLGVCIALDDFGVGYNSYNCIRNIPLDIIKIDKSYIHDMRRNDVSKYIIESIISLANTLKMKVIAEGLKIKKMPFIYIGKEFVICKGIIFLLL